MPAISHVKPFFFLDFDPIAEVCSTPTLQAAKPHHAEQHHHRKESQFGRSAVPQPQVRQFLFRREAPVPCGDNSSICRWRTKTTQLPKANFF
jgi:hypothetical protein